LSYTGAERGSLRASGVRGYRGTRKLPRSASPVIRADYYNHVTIPDGGSWVIQL